MKLKELFNRMIKTATPEQEAAHTLYEELSKPEYNDRRAGFYTDDHHEDMSLVHESIFVWWKPRFLMDNRTGPRKPTSSWIVTSSLANLLPMMWIGSRL